MSLRLLRVVAPRDAGERVRAIVEGHVALAPERASVAAGDGSAPESGDGTLPKAVPADGPPRYWTRPLDDGLLQVDVLLPAAGSEPLLDELETAFTGEPRFRMVLLPVQAAIPRLEEPDPETEAPDGEADDADGADEAASAPPRISREELYAEMGATARVTRHYLLMVLLSAVVAGAGLLMGDTAVIIGAMVIAPLLGPNMALAFAATLGDGDLARRALWASAAGAATALAASVVVGLVASVDPAGAEVASRSRVDFAHIALALAAGAAGALSLTVGVAAGIVGVMVAVALLPPLAAAGLLLGDGHLPGALGALLLVVTNVVCVNLGGIGAFLLQGVRPLFWWEESRARRSVILTTSVWLGLLLVLAWAVLVAWPA